MKETTRRIIAAIALAALTGTAQAGSYTPPVAEEPYVPPAAAAHDWTGWYGDIYAGHWFNSPIPPGGNFTGFNIGYLTGSSTFLYGGELGVLYDPSPTYSQFTLDGRIATTVSDRAMVFANLGLGRDSIAVNFVEYSVGGQFAFSNNMYMRGEIVGQTAIGGGTSSAVRLGAGLEF